MGWTVFNAPPRGGMVAKVLESISDFGKREIVASGEAGGAVYAAVRVGDKVVGVVGVIEGNGYKLLSEDEGPYFWDCPAEVLEALSPTSSEFARNWRAKCIGVRAAANAKPLPAGAFDWWDNPDPRRGF